MSLARVEAVQIRSFFKCKYLSKWYVNPLPLTIYVNANDLQFSPINGRIFAPCLHH